MSVSINWGVILKGKKETLVNSICRAFQPTLQEIRGFYAPTNDPGVTRLDALLVFKIEVSEKYIRDQLIPELPPVDVEKITPFLEGAQLFDHFYKQEQMQNSDLCIYPGTWNLK